jgi:hypothetical protein
MCRVVESCGKDMGNVRLWRRIPGGYVLLTGGGDDAVVASWVRRGKSAQLVVGCAVQG